MGQICLAKELFIYMCMYEFISVCTFMNVYIYVYL